MRDQIYETGISNIRFLIKIKMKSTNYYKEKFQFLIIKKFHLSLDMTSSWYLENLANYARSCQNSLVCTWVAICYIFCVAVIWQFLIGLIVAILIYTYFWNLETLSFIIVKSIEWLVALITYHISRSDCLSCAFKKDQNWDKI